MSHRIGVEIGGTFTDLVWARADGSLQTGKVPSTPGKVHEAVLQVIDETGNPLSSVAKVTHGSTVATNALLTRRGAKAGVLATAGFRDVLTVGRAERSHDIYSFRHTAPTPPVRPSQIREVKERIAADGRVLIPIDLEQAWAEVEALLQTGVEGIAISLLHAYRNPAHEKALAALIRERAPHLAVSVSHEVSPEFREYERGVTTAINAFVGPVVEQYVGELDRGLQERGYRGVLQIMQSNGGTMPASAAGANAVRMLLSGPAAGVRAAAWFAERNGIRDIITLDMGGTSTDVAIAPSLEPRIVPELVIDGLPVRTASVDMVTIGAGGGSIASIDPGGFLAVGPQSAGANPGPACYGKGGERPTVTDAQAVAGILRPGHFFGGRLPLYRDRAEAALAGLNHDADPARTADAVLRLVNAAMAGAVRLVSTARGVDPRDFTLLAYGGGGPLHAAQVAEEIGMSRVLIPWSPGLASAFGLLIADTVIDFTESRLHRLAEDTLSGERIEELDARARQVAIQNGVDPTACDISIGLDMRYGGQAFELLIWTQGESDPVALRTLFEREHESRYGYKRSNLSVEVVNYRVRVAARNGAAVITPTPGHGVRPAETGDVTIDGRRIAATFIGREGLAAGASVVGPAVIEEPTSTTVVPPGWQATCLPSGDLLLERMP